MGVAIKEILEYDEVNLNFISNKKIAIDTFNMLYQFISSIRQSDGNPLTDSKGNITSHLKGLFYRCVYFKRNNIKVVFVFDGEPPKLKEKERELRKKKKEEAAKKYQQSLDLGLTEDAAKYARGTSKLTNDIIEESKELISAFGFPIILAPSEGEAQTSYLSRSGEVFAASSQDFDSLLFGCKYLIRNISISNKRKIPGTSTYKDIPIEFYDLEKNLKKLNLNREELIIVAILCGTDFNPGGIKGIGPKKAIKIVKEYRERYDEMFKILDWYSYFPYSWVEVMNTFLKMPVNKEVKINYGEMDKDKIRMILTNRDFDELMINRSLNTIKSIKTLDKFF